MLTTHNTSTKKYAQRYIHITTLSEHPPISKKTAQPTSVDTHRFVHRNRVAARRCWLSCTGVPPAGC